MASIKEERTKKHLSFKIRVCLGRDESGKQISKAMRWHLPEGMTPAKAKKKQREWRQFGRRNNLPLLISKR